MARKTTKHVYGTCQQRRPANPEERRFRNAAAWERARKSVVGLFLRRPSSSLRSLGRTPCPPRTSRCAWAATRVSSAGTRPCRVIGLACRPARRAGAVWTRPPGRSQSWQRGGGVRGGTAPAAAPHGVWPVFRCLQCGWRLTTVAAGRWLMRVHARRRTLRQPLWLDRW